MRTSNKRLILSLSLLLLLLSGCGDRERLTVVFPKVGSADAAVLMTSSATVVIDTGEDGDGDKVLDILKDHHRDTVDLLVISHYDKDHVGGAAEILEKVTVSRVIGSTSPKVSDETAAYYAALLDKGLTEEVLDESCSLSLDGMELTILPPGQAEYDSDQSNNSSTVVRLQYGDTSFFFAGDSMNERVAELVPELEDDVFDLIKIPHHGRDADTTTSLLPCLKPGAAAIITSSKKEPENQDVLNMLQGSGVSAYLTRNGTITVVSDGHTLQIEQD